jgi:molybdate transport system ATP-binding protein
MIHKVVVDAATRTLARTLYVDVKLVRENRLRLDAEFTLAPGITMLLGPSGAGKTTLLDCIAGLLRPDRGRIVAGNTVLFDADERINVPVRKRRCGYLFQDLALFPHMSLRHNIEYGIAHLAPSERDERVQQILRAFHIEELASRRPSSIASGEQQRAGIARALVTDPDFLLLDEPLAAIDANSKTRMMDDLRAWNASHGIPILYVTHERREAYAMGERVLVLEAGQIVAEGTPHDVLGSPRRETVAPLAGFENVFDVEVERLNEDYGTIGCRVLGPQHPSMKPSVPKLPGSGAPEPRVSLEVPLIYAQPGERLRLGIRAGDILISLERPTGLSARNLIPAKILALRREGTTVVAETSSTERPEIRFTVHLTPHAVENLHLSAGEMVWLVLKTHSCHLMKS